MKVTAIVSAFLALGANAAEMKTVGDGAIEGQYIVKMKDSCTKDTLRAMAAKRFTSGVWENLPGFQGFAARMTDSELEETLANDDVEYVEQDSWMYAIGNFRNQTADAEARDACSNTQTTTSSWGQSRTTRTSGYSTRSFDHEASWGQGVKIYVIDTGTYCSHSDFAACECGPTYAGGTNGCSDGNGHGTHCSSTAAGAQWGIAKSATVVGVKVLSDSGSGATSGVINGMDWVASQGSGSVASMSLGGGRSTASNNAVDSMTRAGVTVVVAAGNSNANACNYSPSSAPTAFTVGATTTSDSRSSFSNYGTCVDVFAPGSSITAAWYTSSSSTNTISGTSMACPHVAGAAAAVLSENPGYSPTQVKNAISTQALSNVVSSPGTGSPNKLL